MPFVGPINKHYHHAITSSKVSCLVERLQLTTKLAFGAGESLPRIAKQLLDTICLPRLSAGHAKSKNTYCLLVGRLASPKALQNLSPRGSTQGRLGVQGRSWGWVNSSAEGVIANPVEEEKKDKSHLPMPWLMGPGLGDSKALPLWPAPEHCLVLPSQCLLQVGGWWWLVAAGQEIVLRHFALPCPPLSALTFLTIGKCSGMCCALCSG